VAAIDPARDPRGARWEQRLRVPVLTAAWLAIPTVFLYFSKLEGALAVVAVTLAWSIWVVFLVEAVVMLSVVRDKRAWLRGHLFSIGILVATFPLLTHALEALLAARALSGVQAVRVLQVLYLAKAGKLIKGLLIVRRSGRGPRHPVLASLLGLLIAAILVGIGDRIVTGDKHATPLHGTVELIESLPHWSLALAAAALVVVVLTAATGRRRAAGRPPASPGP
jgi:hypothetical protein